jgi:[ribosomal protein S18]-alanine N-acetyltransferase
MDVRDLAEVHAIEVCSFSNPWHKTTFLGEIQNRSIAYPYVAVSEPEHAIIGYIMFWLIEDEGQINNIAVHPDFRGKGIGEEIVRFALDKIRHLGGTFVTLEVRQSNAAAASLYQKMGFTLLGVREGYYQNPSEDARVMSLDLTGN